MPVVQRRPIRVHCQGYVLKIDPNNRDEVLNLAATCLAQQKQIHNLQAANSDLQSQCYSERKSAQAEYDELYAKYDALMACHKQLAVRHDILKRVRISTMHIAADVPQLAEHNFNSIPSGPCVNCNEHCDHKSG
ncbi:hypothetical protein B0H10DRAFT_2209294 [Mycena sp. CBHHK59/15]|nr:hypothetical protein B0H10DRAFT_2209294 [Mycena sp. CBHHK59/15]